MIDRDLLLKDTQKLVKDLVDDLSERTDDVDDIRENIRGHYSAAREAGRTDRSYEEWREDLLAQVAVAWVLATVFVRFCEDNRLYETPLLSGPGARRDLAGDHRADWLAENPAAGDREWLMEVFARYREIPATEALFGGRNPLWQVGPSDDGAKGILDLWQTVEAKSGDLRHDFADPDLDTRFLGDLYQDLSEHAKKTYALLQTPEFVEEFILDRTLEPAVDTFGLAEVKLIDPACGSGHFLLGAFERLLGRWRQREPGTPVRKLVQKALDAVAGVDLNPTAAEIARFRLLVAAIRVAEITQLSDAPAFRIAIAVGDSLIHGKRTGEIFSGAEGFSRLLHHRYVTEDTQLANQLLIPGAYQAVVGNPPYITVKDKAVRDAYRALYHSAYGQYSLAVPFKERFFDLAVSPSDAGAGGYIGMITSNSFMKRSFGRKVVEDFLPSIDLTHIIDTSGAYIPGHGIPTVILLGRHQTPESESVRAVLGIRGEPGTPVSAAEGKVWNAIVASADKVGAENEYVSVEDIPRERFKTHPWSLQGGAAPETAAAIERAASGTLEDLIDPGIGRAIRSGADEAFIRQPTYPVRHGHDPSEFHRLADGEDVRDWALNSSLVIWYPYPKEEREQSDVLRELWPLRTTLASRSTFQGNMADAGRAWWEYMQHTASAYDTPLSIAFTNIATHNHFVLDRGGSVFNAHAPVIKLPADATTDDHLELLGLLNSSAACFWMKQVFHCKGSTVDQRGARQTTVPFEDFYEFDGTKLKQFPIPARAPLERSRELDELAQRLSASLPSAVAEQSAPTRENLEQASLLTESLRARMVAVQEELDWECYSLYGLTDEELTAPAGEVPDLEKGQRAFEIVLARKMAAGEIQSTWFKRHGSQPITELPAYWSDEYRRVVERRLESIASDRSIRLLEKPEHKRRWNWDSWEDLQEEALENWLLDRLEAEDLWAEPELMTTARLADRVRGDDGFMEAARLYKERVDVDLTELVTELVADQAVPFAVGYRFKPSGMRFRREWEHVWELQREEDDIDARTELPEEDPQHLTVAEAERLKEERGLDDIPVPPKYRKADYSDGTAYKLRGRLDVPQERFISYPGTRKSADTTLVIGWAGWDYLEQTRALSGQYAARKDQGADERELTGLLAGLQELVPWLKQWHNDVEPAYGQRMGDFFASFVESEAKGIGRTVDDLKTWTP